MIYINLSSPYEEAVILLKHFYAEKANQGMVEYLIRAEAIKLDLWPGGKPVPDPNAGGVWPWPPSEDDVHSTRKAAADA